MTVRLGLLHHYSRSNVCLVNRRRNVFAKLLRQFLHLPADICPRIKSRKQNASYLYSRIAILLNAGDGLVELGDPGGRKNPRRCRNQNVGGTGEGVHRQPPREGGVSITIKS